MKSIYLSFGIMAITLFGCEKEPKLRLDGVPESVAQLMGDNCFCDPRIGLFKWNEQLFYVHWIAGPACDGIPGIYDDEGNKVEFTQEEHQTFWEEKELVKMIWVCGE